MSESENENRQPLYRNPQWLEHEYHENGQSLAEIADECGVAKKTIWRACNRYDIDRRAPAGAENADANYRDSDWLRQEYVANHRSITEIATECDVDPSTIRRWLDVHDIPTRDPPHEGEDGVCCYITANDYHLVCVGDKTVGLHQLLALLKGTPAELVFGTGGNTVACHHANGCSLDNRLENIQPMDWATHSALHRRAEGPPDAEAAAAVNAHCPLPTRFTATNKNDDGCVRDEDDAAEPDELAEE